MSLKPSQQENLLAVVASFDLWSFLAWHDIKIKYRRSKIGPFWITLSMTFFCVALGVVYGQLFKTNIADLLPYLATGLVIWNYISSCIGEMPNLFVDNASYIKDMRINPLTILLRAFTRSTIIFGHNLIIVLGIYLYFQIWPGWPILWALPGFLLLLLNMIAIGIPLSVIGARFRDISQITQSILQVIFFITPIFWFPRLLSEGSWITAVNPISYFLDLIRSPLLGRHPEPLSWAVSFLTLALASIVAAWVYRRKGAYIAFWV